MALAQEWGVSVMGLPPSVVLRDTWPPRRGVKGACDAGAAPGKYPSAGCSSVDRRISSRSTSGAAAQQLHARSAASRNVLQHQVGPAVAKVVGLALVVRTRPAIRPPNPELRVS